ncbi:hypothetical protein GGR42_001941 [Saonia flava]|uniref:Uncharacterized protein n=1 Tax=Saonia flava TaxID=523696 RepID=A0A846R3T5_9FLAO|nr:hypothetical protein [Saonia flava]NJB71479.1 hypothetical protein [Saonia flava]
MKKSLSYVFLLIFIQSCIPIRIAPNISDYKLTTGKKFKRNLPKRNMFIFEDPKEAGHFYDYVNIKFQLNDEDVYDDVPFVVDGIQYFFAFYETEIQDKSIPILAALMDVALSRATSSDDYEPVFTPKGGVYRKGNWYIAIEVYSDLEKDCLGENSFSREVVLKYLRSLKDEYLSTHNYNEIVLKN